jgi:uncharacterized membrane protein YqjE
MGRSQKIDREGLTMIDDPARSAGGTLGEYAYRDPGQRSMADVLKDIISNVQEMVRSEVRLAKAELREEAARSAAAGKLMVMGGGMALLAVGFVLTAVAQLLALVMPNWLATLIVGAVLGGAGMALLSRGRAQFVVPRPNKTIESVKENVQWMKNQTK